MPKRNAGLTYTAEKPTRKAIENRVFRLRKESIDALRQSGIYDANTAVAGGEEDGDSSEDGEQQTRTKRPRLMSPTPEPTRRSSGRGLRSGRRVRAPAVTRNNLDVEFGRPDVRQLEEQEELGDEIVPQDEEDDLYE